MNKLRLSIISLFTIGLLSSCNFISNYFKYSDKSKEFVNDILKEDYDNAIQLFELDHLIRTDGSQQSITNSFTKISVDTLRSKLPTFRDILVGNFGPYLQYSMMSTTKNWSSEKKEDKFPNSTVVLMQISNEKEFGIIKFWFDDSSKKIVYVEIQDVKEPIPNMVFFWLFGLLPFCILLFNIYMIVLVKRSKFKKKWKKYITILFLNVPSFTYNAIGSFNFQLFIFQILFGMSFKYEGYSNSVWEFGMPIGGLYILWQLRNGKDKPIEETTKNSKEDIHPNDDENLFTAQHEDQTK